MGSRASIKIVALIIGFLLFMPGLLISAEEDFLVAKIKVTGNQVLKSDTFAPIVTAYEGKRATFTDLQKVASLITEEYRKRGYVIAKAFVPEQQIVNDTVEIAVLEGKIGEVKVEGDHKYYSTAFIRKHFDPILKEKALNQETLERALMVLNEYPKLAVQANLQAGKEPGTTDLIVTANNSMPIHLTVDYNNFGSNYTNRNRVGLTFDVGNFLKEGSVLSLRGISGFSWSDMLFGRISYSIPLNTLGTRLAAYYAKGDFEVGEEFRVLEIKGKIEQYGISVAHPFIKTRLQTLTAELGFDGKDARQFLLGEITSHDRIRSLRGGLTWEQTNPSGRTYATFGMTQGLGHQLGGMISRDPYAGEPYASRVGADNSFTRFNLDAIRLQRLHPSFFLILKGSGQFSSDSLVSSEQFSLGGADSVRGYVPGEFSGDDGFSLTAELRVSPLTNKELFQVAFFLDTGSVYTRDTVVGQKARHSLTGGGGGVRLNLPYDFNIRADVGFPIDPGKNADGKSVMYYLQAIKRF
jgi:hemolysin activation/secretion protein